MKKFLCQGLAFVFLSSMANAGRFENVIKSGEKIAEEVIKKSRSGVLITPGFKPDKQAPLPLKTVSSTQFPRRVKWLDYDRGLYVALEPWSWSKIKKDLRKLMWGQQDKD